MKAETLISAQNLILYRDDHWMLLSRVSLALFFHLLPYHFTLISSANG
jgi:hypothetical protein